MADFVYPTAAELGEIAQEKLPRLAADRLGFRVMPTREIDSPILMWEQKDNYTGLQQLRGLGGLPRSVQHVAGSRFQMEPGYYGEFKAVDETHLTMRRQWGTFGTPINVTDLVMECQDHLLERRLDRIEAIIWTLLATGTFSVSGPNGIVHSDTYSLQTYNASDWGTAATATILADFRAVQLLGRGNGVNFGAQAVAYMNRATWNLAIANTNAADLGGRRTSGLAPANTLDQVNMLLAGDDLPRIAIYDEGYLNDSAVFVPYIPIDVVIVVGARPAGQNIGYYAYTRNVNTPGMAPGPYMKVIDRGEEQVPRLLEVHDGHNGGPCIEYPSAVVRMDVS